MRVLRLCVGAALGAFLLGLGIDARAASASSDPQAIAEDAFVYGFPMVMNYGVISEYFIDQSSAQYKTGFNQLFNTARVYTPEDTTVVTPNSDTPYSFVGMDLRAEPLVLCVPEIEKGRYLSVQLVDLYTSNYGYIGSRTTGNAAACHVLAGPTWKGEKPANTGQLFRSETEFALAIIRTQLFDAADIENVKKIQAGYRVETLSHFRGEPAPPPAPAIEWPKIDKQLAAANPFAYLAFLLQFCPPIGAAEVEKPLRARFADIGIEAGKPFAIEKQTAERKTALAAGAEQGLAKIKQRVASIGKLENGWRVATGGFGDRAALAGDWTLRAAAAMAGIYGNDAVEALYPMLSVDSEGEPLDTGAHRYTLTFPAGELPPANAFWSVTMYDGKTQLLIANPIDRYLINAPMLANLKKGPGGSLTLYLQKDAPGAEQRSNWLPASDGSPYVVMRVYWPKPAALDGTWKPPAVVRVE